MFSSDMLLAKAVEELRDIVQRDMFQIIHQKELLHCLRVIRFQGAEHCYIQWLHFMRAVWRESQENEPSLFRHFNSSQVQMRVSIVQDEQRWLLHADIHLL